MLNININIKEKCVFKNTQNITCFFVFQLILFFVFKLIISYILNYIQFLNMFKCLKKEVEHTVLLWFEWLQMITKRLNV